MINVITLDFLFLFIIFFVQKKKRILLYNNIKKSIYIYIYIYIYEYIKVYTKRFINFNMLL